MKSGRILIPIFGLVMFLVLVKLLFANMLSTTGVKLAKLQEGISTVSQESTLLEEEIARLSSLTRISSEAEKLGFAKPSLVLNLKPEFPVALK